MLRLEARAKINWTLDILGIREDGYHLMDMLMQSVMLADEITLEESDHIELRTKAGLNGPSAVSSQDAAAEAVPFDERNIAYKAALALQQYTGCTKGASITLQKNIPSGAGMGGGSADAAAVLAGLNQMWQLNLSMQELLAIGLKLGADVPFMLTGGLARVGGIGEKIERLSPAPAVWLVLIQPCDGLSTKEIFTAYDNPHSGLTIAHPRTEDAQKALLRNDLTALGSAMDNVLEGISISKRPAIAGTVQMLEKLGAIRGMMTGSGSVVYGVFADEASARGAQNALREKGIPALITCTAQEGIMVYEI
ncbi:MAG: 4-(cytidine 5'-diphospho)-2-C-methyl-D-erythritol kinase [Clostridia bacterium]|nr:4-(cytidine 5'-diphospho)-2-C-methyl-D-erythritol kinase [Clostridia bacterium]